MLSVTEAQNVVLQHVPAPAPEATSLTPAALGTVVAEDVLSDLDMPPYDKALMDGYAVRAADLARGGRTLNVVEEVTAGQTPRLAVGPGEATRIMTGAPLPSGADAVVMVEQTLPLDGNLVQIDAKEIRPAQNVMHRGREMRRGEKVLTAGTVLRPQEFGLLATVGRTAVQTYPRPRVAVLSTGDEVVEAPQFPGPGQIRNGNGPMLLAQAARAGGIPRYLGIARDGVDSLRPLISEGLRSSVLILSGGVSAGKLDLVPGVLRELDVEAHFHKVAMKPGKPVFFGTRQGCLVFGLPGNPVSAMVCFELFVRPAVRRLMGHAFAGPLLVSATLAEDFASRTDRPTYYPSRLEETSQGRQVTPVPWFGSPDLRAVTQANAFLVVPAGESKHVSGDTVTVLCVEW